MLSALLRATPKVPSREPEPEDYFQASLGLIFTDDLQNQHGDPDTFVTYRSNGYGDLKLDVADPQGETERTKFAHHLWNAGVLMAELVGGRKKEYKGDIEEEEWGRRNFAEGKNWWVDEEEEMKWDVENETVIELGAGV
jgi:nicotinamide N-methyltransferase